MSPRETPTLDVRVVTLANGLTVLGERDPNAQSVALGYFVRTGARDEDPSDLGASHFIEHLLFKGSERLSGNELNERFDALGANTNAFTSEETTVYHAACLPDGRQELLFLLTELLRPAFREQDVETERGVILEEIAMYGDDPASRAFDELRARAWGPHPLGHLVLGTAQTVSNLTAARLRENFERRYGAENVTLVACGNFEWNALLSEAEELTHVWPRGRWQREFTAHHFTSGVHVIPNDDLARVQFAMFTPGLPARHPLREAAVVLADILGGDNGRLYWTLVDAGLADSADFSHVEFEDYGAFEGGWSCDPERATQTLALVREELERVQREGVTDAEVARSRKKLAVGAALRAETPYARLFSLGMDYLYLQRPVTVYEGVAAFERVTAGHVREVLATAPFDQLTIVALGPVSANLNVQRKARLQQ